MNTTIPNALAAAAACPSEGSINTEFLQSLVGFNARMASLHLIDTFMHAVAEHGLRVVDFSILSVVGHNAGITSSQLCACLNLLPPNLVAKVRSLEKKGWLQRQPHPLDGRAHGLHLTEAGQTLIAQAEAEVQDGEAKALAHLSSKEQTQLRQLLRRVYQRS